MRTVIVSFKTTRADQTFTAGENEHLVVTPGVSTLVVERVSGVNTTHIERWGFNIDNVRSWTER